ncbi:patatin-like phospholipase family protein [Paludibacterium paludis]|nr:patatin-like phospholipase family protein [Paludibacterium paludis]
MATRGKTGKKSVALVLGGGAPNATLMAGTLEAFIEQGIEFDVISTAGAGALVGLLYVAPRADDARSALRMLIETGVDDTLYALFPVNFKVFNKPGALADLWRAMARGNPVLSHLQKDRSALGRAMADWTELMLASWCPSGLTCASTGLCAHVPFIDDLVDFSKLAAIGPEFYLNAYNLSRRAMRCWSKEEIGQDQFLAALSFPFLYPPYQIDGEYYIEGAAIDTLNFKGLFQTGRSIDTVVVFDVLGCERLMRPPTDLYDAWVQSIITPLVELARDDLKLFESRYNLDPQTGKPRCDVLRVNYDAYLSDRDCASELDWSRTNLARLYDIGFKAGLEFCEQYRDAI